MFEIPVLVYDPTNAPKTLLPTKETSKDPELALSQLITDCRASCLKTNKVGSYSKLITTAWSFIKPTTPLKDVIFRLKHIAQIACGINHAVDSQKTGSLRELPRWLIKLYKADPYSERYKQATPEKPSDSHEWDNPYTGTLPRGYGAVERMERIVELAVPAHLRLDTSELSCSWNLLRYEPWGYGFIGRGPVSARMVTYLEQYTKVKLLFDANGTIGLNNLTFALSNANGAFWAAFQRKEDDGIIKSCTKADRMDLVRHIYLEFVKASDSLEMRGMTGKSDLDLLRWISNNLVKTFWGNRKTGGVKDDASMYKARKFIIENFGDIMADAVIQNRMDGTPAISDPAAFGPLTDEEKSCEFEMPDLVYTADDVPPEAYENNGDDYLFFCD